MPFTDRHKRVTGPSFSCWPGGSPGTESSGRWCLTEPGFFVLDLTRRTGRPGRRFALAHDEPVKRTGIIAYMSRGCVAAGLVRS